METGHDHTSTCFDRDSLRASGLVSPALRRIGPAWDIVREAPRGHPRLRSGRGAGALRPVVQSYEPVRLAARAAGCGFLHAAVPGAPAEAGRARDQRL